MKTIDPTKPWKLRVMLWISRQLPSCAEVSRLASRSLDTKLSLRERLVMRLHFLCCAWCERYLRQLRFLRSAARAQKDHSKAPTPQKMPVNTRQRLAERLREEMDSDGEN